MEIQSEGRRLLFSTVLIETSTIDGTPLGSGTSFVFQDGPSGAGRELFLVSNKHVVESGWRGHLFFTPQSPDGTPLVGEPVMVEMEGFSTQWHGHPDNAIDVAVMPLSWQLDLIAKDNQRAFLRPVTPSDLLADGDLEKLDIARPILFVGYPNGMFDRKHYTPIVRQGVLATPPELDFDDAPVFLIDASVFPGSSGSPVFSYERTWKGDIGTVKLIGLISAVFTQRTDGEIEWAPAPTNLVPFPTINQMIDLGVVLKAHLIKETIADYRARRN